MDLTDFRAEQGPTVFANQRDHHCALADAPRGESVSLGQAFLGRLPMSFRRFVFPSDPRPSRRAHKGPAFFAYSGNDLFDVNFGVIVASRAIC